MKTQINTVVNGSKISIGNQSTNGGTNYEKRNQLFSQVLQENPNSIKLTIDGFEMELAHKVSTTGKTHSYSGVAPIEFWNKYLGDMCIKKNKENTCIVTLCADCSVNATINGSSFWANIQNDLIIIS
jgi:hypothetical protein